MLTIDERKKLHGPEYLKRFEQADVSGRLKRLVNLMKFDKGSALADFGCGSGMILPLVANSVGYYYGIDFSENFINCAKENQSKLGIINASFFCEDIASFCERHYETIDHALCLDLSEHVYDDEWTSILESIHRCLKPGGTLYLHTPNAIFFVEQMKARNLVLKQFAQHIAVRTTNHNLLLIQRAGFKDTRVTYIAHYNLLRFVHPLSVLPLIGSFFRARIFLEAKK